MPHQNLCEDTALFAASHIAGTPYLGAEAKMHETPEAQRGGFMAWDPVARKKVWSIPERFPVWSGALVTGGDVVFYGTMDGLFKAVDARTGRLLWQYQLNSGTIGLPIAYRGPDGRQYVAIFSGVGGWSGAIVSGALDSGGRAPPIARGSRSAGRRQPGAARSSPDMPGTAPGRGVRSPGSATQYLLPTGRHAIHSSRRDVACAGVPDRQAPDRRTSSLRLLPRF